MITKIDKFVKSLENNTTDDKLLIYAQIIKNERKKRNMTLEEMSKGICSVSYLSKVENNTLVPAEDYLVALFERIDLNYNTIENDLSDELLKLMFKYYLFENGEKIREIYNKSSTKSFSSIHSLIKCINHLYFEDYDSFKEEIIVLNEIKNSLNKLQGVCLIILVVLFYIEFSQYKKAMLYLESIKNVRLNIKEIDLLVAECFYVVSFHLDKQVYMFSYYQQLMQNNDLSYPYLRKIKIKYMMKTLECEINPEDALNEIEWSTEESETLKNNLTINFYRFIVNIKCKNYLNVYNKILDSFFYSDIRMLSLMFYCACMLHDNELLNRTIKLYEDGRYSNIESLDYYYINYVIQEYNHLLEKDKGISFFKFKVIPYMQEHNHYLYTKILTITYANKLADIGKYKEAYLFLLNKNLL